MKKLSTLSSIEIRILRQLNEGEKSIPELKQELKLSSQQLSRSIKSLKEKSLVVDERKGLTKAIRFSNDKHAQMLRDVLIDFSHMRLEKVLSLSSLRILISLAFSSGMTREEISFYSKISLRTIATILKRLREIGLVIAVSPGVYCISPRFSSVAEFAIEFRKQSVYRTIISIYPDALIRWLNSRSVLIETTISNEQKGFRKTAFSAFNQFGVSPFLAKHWYINLPDNCKPKLEEVIIHTLLLRPYDSRSSKIFNELLRKIAYKINEPYLVKLAKDYGISEELSEISTEIIKWKKSHTPTFKDER